MVGDLIGDGPAQEQSGVGESFNLAARLQSRVEPNTVVIDCTTRRLLGELFEYHALGSMSIKRFAGPIPVWHVTGASAIDSRFAAEARQIVRRVPTEICDRFAQGFGTVDLEEANALLAELS